MKVGGAVVQAMWLMGNSPLLQLPHLSPALLRHFKTKKVNCQDTNMSEPPNKETSRLFSRVHFSQRFYDIVNLKIVLS